MQTARHVADGYWTTRGYANSRTGRLADWSTRVLDKSRTGQLADAIGDFAFLVFVLLAASASPRVVESATCPVRELAIRELAYPRVVQLPGRYVCRPHCMSSRGPHTGSPRGSHVGVSYLEVLAGGLRVGRVVITVA